jgi:archaellum component FlaF (FlaF/FlaG flagellin family)
MLYSTISSAIVMFIVGLVCLPLTYDTWCNLDRTRLIYVIWASLAAKHYNDKLLINQQYVVRVR